jgi:hypothetical protein
MASSRAATRGPAPFSEVTGTSFRALPVGIVTRAFNRSDTRTVRYPAYGEEVDFACLV